MANKYHRQGFSKGKLVTETVKKAREAFENIYKTNKKKQNLIDQYGIQTISSELINNDPQEVIRVTNQFIGNSKFHLSIDIDGLDPQYTPSTGTPVENGIKMDSLIKLMKSLNNKNKIFTDIVEFNPNLGSTHDRILTQNNVKKLIQYV